MGPFKVFSMPDDLCRSHFASFYSEECKPLLLLAQMDSRYRNKKYHNTFVLVNTIGPEINEHIVLGYYCECYNGLRTVGCCSHTMTVLWFTLFMKNRNISNPAGFLDDYFHIDFDDGVNDDDAET